MTSKIRIAVGPSSFGQFDQTPIRMLEQAGVEIVPNPLGRRFSESEIIRQLTDADGLLAGLEPLNRKVFDESPKLRAVARVGTGMSNVDLDAAAEKGIKVSNTPDAATEAVAELTIAALLCLTRRVMEMNGALHEERWEKRVGRAVRGSTALVIGLGRIGRRVAKMLRWLGAEILAYDPYAEIDPTLGTRTELIPGLERADFVLVHASSDRLIIGRDAFKRMKEGAYLLNAGRGVLVDEAALIEALESGHIAGAWLDVFVEEPYRGPLTKHPKALLTPHVGSYTAQCRLQMECEAVRNLLRDLGYR